MTIQRSSSFGWPTRGVKALMAASNLATISDDDIIVVWRAVGLDY